MAVEITDFALKAPAGGAAFDSGTLDQNEEFTFTPHVRGTWVYHCDFHPEDMTNARIVVE